MSHEIDCQHWTEVSETPKADRFLTAWIAAKKAIGVQIESVVGNAWNNIQVTLVYFGKRYHFTGSTSEIDRKLWKIEADDVRKFRDEIGYHPVANADFN